jgi:hypothetical protein
VVSAQQLSGLYYPNKIARIFFEALEEILGKTGMVALLNTAKLPQYINQYPPDNMDLSFDFAYFAMLQEALEEIMGPRGGRGMALRAGRLCFSAGLTVFGPLAGVTSVAFSMLPLSEKIKAGLPAIAFVFNTFSDQKTVVQEQDDHFVYVIKKCPLCWGRKTDKPCGQAAIGLLQESLRWVSGGQEFDVEETACIGMGAEEGTFLISKKPQN